MDITGADIEADLALFDGLDTVTVLQINPQTGATVATDADVTVLKRAEEKQETSAGEDGQDIPVTTTRFHLRASTCSFVPKERDQIVDGSDVWVITKLTKAAFATRYICEVTKYPG
jgi:hypothetical protein